MNTVDPRRVEKAARALLAGSYRHSAPPPFKHVRILYEERARAVLEAVADDIARAAWPCDNYTAPVTCISAPSSEAGRCLFCATTTSIIARAERERVLAEVEALGVKWIAEDDTTQWGTHAKNGCGRALRALVARLRDGGAS